MKVFIVGGKSGSGKNEVAKMIEEYYTYKLKKCVLTEYSKYLKIFATELTNWDGVSADKPRDFFQKFGALLREYDSHFFGRRMVEDINIFSKVVDVVIISDARMPLEIEDVYESFDDVTSFIVVNQFSNSKLTLEQQSDITETALEDYQEVDYIIANDDINKTKEKVFKILEGLD